jgi:hypothetical protein
LILFLKFRAKLFHAFTAAHRGEKIIARNTVSDFGHARDLKHDLAVRRLADWNSSNENPWSVFDCYF